jgi:hypothetical protein
VKEIRVDRELDLKKTYLGFKSSFLKSSLGPIHKIIEKNKKYPQRCGRCASPTSMREEALLVAFA